MQQLKERSSRKSQSAFCSKHHFYRSENDFLLLWKTKVHFLWKCRSWEVSGFKKSFLTLFEHFLFKMKSFVWEFLCISRSIGSWALWNFFQSAETFLIIFEQKLSNLWRNLAILYEKWAYFQCHKEIFLCHSCSRASWGLCKWKCSSFMLQLLWELYWKQSFAL